MLERMNDLSEHYQLLQETHVDKDTLEQYREDMDKKMEEKILEHDKLKDNQFKQIENLMKRIYLLENKYQEQ